MGVYSTAQSLVGGNTFGVGMPMQHVDQNSPIIFKQRLAEALVEVNRLQMVAMEALSGVQNAYHINQTPLNTSRVILELKLALDSLMTLLRSTGIGALPLLPPPSTSSTSESPNDTGRQGPPSTIPVPSEAQLLGTANHTVKTLYDTLKKKQESAAVVANLLTVEQLRPNQIAPATSTR